MAKLYIELKLRRKVYRLSPNDISKVYKLIKRIYPQPPRYHRGDITSKLSHDDTEDDDSEHLGSSRMTGCLHQ